MEIELFESDLESYVEILKNAGFVITAIKKEASKHWYQAGIVIIEFERQGMIKIYKDV
jgi:hypothetical protein